MIHINTVNRTFLSRIKKSSQERKLSKIEFSQQNMLVMLFYDIHATEVELQLQV